MQILLFKCFEPSKTSTKMIGTTKTIYIGDKTLDKTSASDNVRTTAAVLSEYQTDKNYNLTAKIWAREQYHLDIRGLEATKSYYFYSTKFLPTIIKT